jgi:hypothetical protein
MTQNAELWIVEEDFVGIDEEKDDESQFSPIVFRCGC